MSTISKSKLLGAVKNLETKGINTNVTSAKELTFTKTIEEGITSLVEALSEFEYKSGKGQLFAVILEQLDMKSSYRKGIKLADRTQDEQIVLKLYELTCKKLGL